jgi:3-oxoacyl-[acyl-carrier protein] reductase
MGVLENKKIVITGGSQGIGYAIAEKCIAEGAEVILVARNESDLKEAIQKLASVSPKRHRYYVLDISDLKAVQRFAAWTSNEQQFIDGLVNCAGVYGPIGKTSTVDLADFTKTITINFLGTVYMCSVFAPLLKSTTRKKIVNYAGGGAAMPFPNYSAYATSKIAVVRFTENLSMELSSDAIDINCVAPGFVITRLHQQTLDAGRKNAGEEFYKSTQKQIESGGIPPQKAAELTCFLLSQASDGITGKFISAPWDPWHTGDFQKRLRNDKDIATLRRIDNKTFFKKNQL